MKKIVITLFITMGLVSFIYGFFNNAKPKDNTTITDFYEFKIKGIKGDEIKFSSFKGKKVLLVNVASECGYTPQYEGLEKLYKKYGDKLVVIGFPCNQFGGQEPGSPEEIQKFCSSKYGVTFLMTEKIDVKGADQHPIYQWLTQKGLNGVEDSNVKWNFNKYLISETGKYISHFPSRTDPLSTDITSLIEK